MSPNETTTGTGVRLCEITAKTVREITRLSVSESQRKFVADNATSIAQAYFEKKAWFRAVYAGDTAVGFVMLHDDPEKPEYFLWRFMIDERYQGKGYGRKAIALLLGHVRSRPRATKLLTSAVPGDGSPQPFYEKLGFVPTGVVEDGEVVLELKLERAGA